MADIPATHYVKSDDVHIAYQVIGDGPRDLLFVPGVVSNVEALGQIAAYFRASASPGAASAIMRMNREIDVRDILPVTRVPTLILHRTDERVIDVKHARYMAQQIPCAKLIELSGQDHTVWFGN